MKKFGQLLKDLGFNQNAAIAAQEAFLRHMQRAARLEVSRASTPPPTESDEQLKVEQLVFDSEVLGQSRKIK